MRPRHTIPAALIIAALSAMINGPAFANGPIYIPGNTNGTSTLELTRMDGWAEMIWRGTNTHAGEYSQDETILAPGLHLDTSGSIYHPRLIAFDAGGTLSLQRRTLAGANSRDEGLAFEDFGMAIRLFSTKPTNLRIFAERTNGWLASPYRGSTRNTATIWGVEANTGSASVPATLSWSREKNTEEFGDGDRVVERDRLRLGLQRRGRLTRGALTVRHEDYAKNTLPQDYRTDGATGNLTSILGSSAHLRLGARWLHRYGSRVHRDASLWSSVSLTPADDLLLRGELRRHRQQPGAGSTPVTGSTSGNLSLRHTLYGSLESTFTLRMLDEATRSSGTEIGTLQRHGADLRIDYRRRTGAGILSLGWGWSIVREELTATDREQAATNEEHVLRDGDDPRLDHPQVVAGSVVVTDETGFLVYQENIDYVLTGIGPYTLITRLPDGGITDGSAIRADYRYIVSPDATTDTVGRSFLAGFDAHRFWSVWYRRQSSDESLVSGDPDGALHDRTRDVFGARVFIGRLTVENEYETNKLLATHFRSNRIRADYVITSQRSWRTSAGASRTWSRTENPERTERFLQLHVRASRATGSGSNLNAEAWIRLDRGEGDGGDDRYDMRGASLRYIRRFRALTCELGGSYHLSDRNDIDDERLVFRLGVRRDF